MVDQVQNTVSSVLPTMGWMDEREWDVELAKALPAGNIVSRPFKGE
jgi:hypothetical protein